MTLVSKEDELARVVCAVRDDALRLAFFQNLLNQTHPEALVLRLEALCRSAELGEPAACEARLALVDALSRVTPEVTARLRDACAAQKTLAFARMVRATPSHAPSSPPPVEKPGDDLGKTLGARKWLARRPDRKVLEKLLRDPHAEVVAEVLRNSKLTEEDVLRLATRRPTHPDVLDQIARSPRWIHRPRIRLALVLNPYVSPSVAARLVGLLRRAELRLVVESTEVSPAIRVLAAEHGGAYRKSDTETVH